MVLLQVGGLFSSAFDKAATGTGSGTNPKSGQTAATSQADEICVGGVGWEGPPGDETGSWQQSFSAGHPEATSCLLRFL